MRLIDADALRTAMFSYYPCVNEHSVKHNYSGDTLMDYEVADLIDDCIDNAIDIDAVEVVRCKDCMWYTPDTDWSFDEATGKRDHSKIVTKPYGECHGQNFHFTEDGFLRVGDDDFCSYGERRNDNAD